MRDKGHLLGQLAEAVADRTPIDWSAVRPAGSSDGLFGALRSLDLVAARTAGAALPPTVSRPGVAALPRWALAATAACVVAVLLGLAGALFGVHDRRAVPVALQVATAVV